nr:immunoglobulin heavy chain junction region [Mus musculus]
CASGGYGYDEMDYW